MGGSSPTDAMSAVYEKHALSVEEYVNAFRCAPLQAGVIFVIPGNCIGLDLFDHPTTLCRSFPKLVRSYALDALAAPPAMEQAGDLSHFGTKLLEQIAAAPSSSQPAVGMGEEVRIDGKSLCGVAVWALGRYVHMCAFAPNGQQASNEFRTRIRRPSRRYSRRNPV